MSESKISMEEVKFLTKEEDEEAAGEIIRATSRLTIRKWSVCFFIALLTITLVSLKVGYSIIQKNDAVSNRRL
jgi:hypothetical protein